MISDGYKKWIKKVEGKKDIPFEPQRTHIKITLDSDVFTTTTSASGTTWTYQWTPSS